MAWYWIALIGFGIFVVWTNIGLAIGRKTLSVMNNWVDAGTFILYLLFPLSTLGEENPEGNDMVASYLWSDNFYLTFIALFWPIKIVWLLLISIGAIIYFSANIYKIFDFERYGEWLKSWREKRTEMKRQKTEAKRKEEEEKKTRFRSWMIRLSTLKFLFLTPKYS